MKKRGLFIIVILAVVAVVLAIVFINLFIDKNTKSLAVKVNTVVQDGYLSPESEEYETINQYLQDISSRVTSNSDKNEVKNYIDSYQSFVVMGEFFNKQIVFTEFTETFKVERKKVEAGIKNANSAVSAMVKYINENKETVGGSDYWLANTWAECEGYMQKIVHSSIDVFNSLGKIYETSVYSQTMNNQLTSLIFDTVETFSKDIKVKVEDTNVYGQKLYSFVNAYLSENGQIVIYNFNYNVTAQENVKIITEKSTGWETVYQDFVAGSIGA